MIKKFIIKKIFVLAALVSVQNFCVFAEQELVKTEPCTYQEIYVVPSPEFKSDIDFNLCRDDLKHLCYLLVNGCAGYPDMVQRGFKIDKFTEDVISGLNPKKNKVSTDDFLAQIILNLKPYINDFHFSFVNNGEYFFINDKKIVYWSDIYLEKKGRDFFVKEGKGIVENGAQYKADLDTLFYYPLKGENVYRLGFLSSEPIRKKEFEFNGKNISVSLHDDETIPELPMKYREIETADSAYLCMNFFLPPDYDTVQYNGAEVMLKKYVECGEKFCNKKNIVLDLRGNIGGYLTPSFGFYSFLYTGRDMWHYIDECSIEDYMNYDLLYSPVYVLYRYNWACINNRDTKYELNKEKIEMRKSPVKKLYTNKPEEIDYLYEPKKFNGKLILLIDRKSASASELAVVFAKRIFGDENVIVIGENSQGCASFAHGLNIKLPYSKIVVFLSIMKLHEMDSFNLWHGEGTGIFPDCWATRNDLNELIYLITKDDEFKLKLKPIGFNLL